MCILMHITEILLCVGINVNDVSFIFGISHFSVDTKDMLFILEITLPNVQMNLGHEISVSQFQE